MTVPRPELAVCWRQLICVLAVAVLAIAAPLARADYRIAGHGFGHGVGLAQYGAMGYASHTRHTYRWILGRYFPGASRTSWPRARMRVRLKQATAARVSLSIADDGPGMPEARPADARAAGRRGLADMQAEAMAIGASLAIEAGEPHGTRIRLEWPAPT